MIRPYLACAAVVFCVAAPIAGWAAPKVAVVPIDGDAAGELRDAVSEALDGNDLVVIAKKDVNRAINRIDDVSDLSEKDARKLANALEADAVVHGRLADGDGARTLKLQLFVNGKKQKGFTIKFKDSRSLKFRRALHDKMVEKIDAAAPADEAEEEDPAPRRTRRVAKAKAEAEDAEPPKKKGRAKAARQADDEEPSPRKAKAEPERDDGEDAERAEADDDERPRKPAKKKVARASDDDEDDEDPTVSIRARAGGAARRFSANRAAVRLDLGASAAKRFLGFNHNLREVAQRPSRLDTTPVGGARVAAELYPLALMNKRGWLAGFGIAGHYDRMIGMKVGSTAEPETELPVRSQHFSIEGRYRLMLGGGATSPSVTGGFGYGRRSFIVLNRGDLIMPELFDLPDTDYKYLAPRLDVRLPIGRFLALTGGAEGMLVRSAGQIQLADFYGRAKIVGFTGSGGLDVVRGRFALHAAFEYTRIGYTFVPPGGALANGRDGDPDDLDVGGAVDRSFGATATIAVMY